MSTFALAIMLAIQFGAPIYFLQWMLQGHGFVTVNSRLIMQDSFGFYASIYLGMGLILSLSASSLFRLSYYKYKHITSVGVLLMWLTLFLLVIPVQQEIAHLIAPKDKVADKFVNILLGAQFLFISYVLKTPWDIMRDVFSEFLDRTTIKVKNRLTRKTRDSNA